MSRFHQRVVSCDNVAFGFESFLSHQPREHVTHDPSEIRSAVPSGNFTGQADDGRRNADDPGEMAPTDPGFHWAGGRQRSVI